MDQPFLGLIAIFGFAFAPRGWAFCAGQMLAISSNSALFSLLGTTYGGNGTTTFGLPNLQGRTAIGMGSAAGLSPYAIGQTGGTESTTLTTAQMPAHAHGATATSTSTSTSTSALYAEGTAATSQNPAGKMLASSQNIYADEAEQNNRKMSPQAVVTDTTTVTTTTVTVNPSGGNQPFSNMQPFLAVNYCIALQGIFPSRN